MNARTKLILVAGAAVVVAAVVFTVLRPAEAPQATEAGTSAAMVAEGKALFAANCAACHGVNGVGTNQGPPLVHRIYESGHHADISFLLAVKNGVRAHHWPFGNMPPQPQVSDADVVAIVAYVRALQREKGIY